MKKAFSQSRSLFFFFQRMWFIRYENLQQICLNVIVENLEFFIHSERIPQIYIDFLLRVYSKEVFKRFRKKQSISESVMLWFLNEHSRRIYLSITSGTIIKQLQRVGPTITYLNMKESLATENIINSILCCIPNVLKLNLSSTSCADKTLLLIQRMCPMLVDLNVSVCLHVSDQGLINLCGINQSLQTLNVDDTCVTEMGVSVILKGMPNLQRLQHYQFADMFYSINREYLESTCDRTFYNITELTYEICTFNVLNVLQIWASLCPKLNKVCIQFCPSEEELSVCSKMKNLKFLEIHSFDGYMPGIGNPCILTPLIPRADVLTTLILSSLEIPTKELIGSLKNLKTLSLQDVTFSDFVDQDITANKNKLELLVLKQVSLTTRSTYRAVLKLLAVSKGVNELHLCLIEVIPPKVFEVILNSMDYLSVADFSFTPIGAPFVQKFLQLPYLRTIYLDGCYNILSIDDFKGAVLKEPKNSLAWSPQLDENH